jgi:2-oxoglutarate ferredoxin oxidoreductase subunit beta
MPLPLAEYKSETQPDWCPGCGDFSVLAGIQQALSILEIKPHEVMIVSGIGCSSNLPGFINAYGMHTLHGRSVAVAGGAWFANHEMPVIACGGDGDGYGIGIGHFIHAMRRNVNLTYVVMNNGIYGLTTGQVSPTSPIGMKTKSTPRGNIERPINPVALALAAGATYVARGASSDTKHMAQLIAGGIKHRGFALVDVFSPCVTYNKLQTYEWLRKSIYKLEEDHDVTNLTAAFERAQEWGDRIPVGLFYRDESRPVFSDEDAVLKEGPLVKRPLGLTAQQKRDLLETLR